MESQHLSNTHSFEKQFAVFAKLGDPYSDGKFISLAQSDDWMRLAHVFDHNISTNDTYNHFRRLGEKVNLQGYNWFLQELSRTKDIDVGELKSMMSCCNEPYARPSIARDTVRLNEEQAPIQTNPTSYQRRDGLDHTEDYADNIHETDRKRRESVVDSSYFTEFLDNY